MSAIIKTNSEPTPLQFLCSTPATPEEGIARANLLAGRLLGYGWKNQAVIENYVSMAQTGTLGFLQTLVENMQEALYLREPKHAKEIELS